MKVPFYLVVNSKGSVKTTKTQPDLDWNEISIKMDLELPDSLFRKPFLSAEIRVKDSDVQPTVITPEIKNAIQESIREHSGVVVKLNIVDDSDKK